MAHVFVRLRHAYGGVDEAVEVQEEVEANEGETSGELERLVRLVLAAVAGAVPEVDVRLAVPFFPCRALELISRGRRVTAISGVLVVRGAFAVDDAGHHAAEAPRRSQVPLSLTLTIDFHFLDYMIGWFY